MNTDHFLELKKAVQEFKDNHPELSLDNAFVGWFLSAFFVRNEGEAMRALTGGARDKGIDAVHIDYDTKCVLVVQGKYYQRSGAPSEKRSDVMALAQTGEILLLQDKSRFNALLNDADVVVQEVLKKARRVILKDDYSLALQFVTTGKISKSHRKEAKQIIRGWSKVSFEVYSRKELLSMMQDYLEGAAPPVPTVDIPIYRNELFGRYDKDTEISSWIFSVKGNEIAKIFKDIGIRIFARNIRGFLGNTAINKEMQETLRKEPEFFWYFNNGITIICDEARQISERGRTYLRVKNAQVINGQQTTRVLAEVSSRKNVVVMVKIIELTRETEEAHSRYKEIIGKIVRATNRQNAIKSSDLKSNDEEQVRIERQMRKLNYQYVRKRQTLREARRVAGKRYSFMIKKEDLAQRTAACVLSPYEVRLGKNRLFEDDLYPRIFNGRSVYEYFLFYWLGRITERFREKDIRRGYAKWLVLNYLWKEVGNQLKRSIIREKFIKMCERDYKFKKELNPLYRAINETFRATLSFYNKNRRSEDGALIDSSLFFKRTNLYNDFKKFLRRNKNRETKIKNANARFLKYLKKVEV